MQTPNSTTEQIDQDNDFNNIEAVESVYPPEMIDLLDDLLCQSAANDPYFDDGTEPATNDVQEVESEVYCLDSVRLSKYRRTHERRASKERLADRRSSIRMDANGEMQPDRRAQNRAANLATMRNRQNEHS